MAEGFARGAGHETASAGTSPGSGVAAKAVEVMAELGIDVSGQSSDLLDLATLNNWDMVISMGCGVEATCPALKADLDWGLDDPFGQGLDSYRKTRDLIQNLVNEL